MSTIGSLIYQLLLLVVATFAFLVLFAHGPANYFENAKRDFNELISPRN